MATQKRTIPTQEQRFQVWQLTLGSGGDETVLVGLRPEPTPPAGSPGGPAGGPGGGPGGGFGIGGAASHTVRVPSVREAPALGELVEASYVVVNNG